MVVIRQATANVNTFQLGIPCLILFPNCERVNIHIGFFVYRLSCFIYHTMPCYRTVQMVGYGSGSSSSRSSASDGWKGRHSATYSKRLV